MQNTRAFAAAAAACLGVIAVAGCAPQIAHRTRAMPVRLTGREVRVLRGYGSADTAFGFDVLSALCGSQTAANTVISPVSLATGLQMTYLGARGTTATAMARVLHLPVTGRAPWSEGCGPH